MTIKRFGVAVALGALLASPLVHAQNNIIEAGSDTLGNAVPIGFTASQFDPLRSGSSGANLVGADRNIIIGQRSLTRATTNCDGNIVIGSAAAQNFFSSADSNVVIGEMAGSTGLDPGTGTYDVNMTSDQLVIIGQVAGRSLTTATDGVYIGQDAGRLLTTGIDNTFLGSEAGESCVTGRGNSIVGEEAGAFLTTGSYNAFLGEDAGWAISTGWRNTAIGAGAMGSPSDSDSYNNTAVGYIAGENLGEGASGVTWNNTFVGALAGLDVGAGQANTLLGAGAGENTEHADYNTFVGAFSGWENNLTNGTTGEADRNTYMGAAAGQYGREGNDNVVIGALADFVTWDNVTDAELTANFDVSQAFTFDDTGVEGTGDVENSRSTSRVVIIGAKARGARNDSITIGYSADSVRRRSITIGTEAQGTHDDAIAIGYQAASHGNGIAVLGNADNLSIDPGADGVTGLGSPAFRYADAYAKTYHVDADTSAPATIDFAADAGEDNNDRWRIVAADSGDLTIETFANGAYLPAATITNAGDLIVTGELAANSDARLKTNVHELSGALGIVEKLRPRQFEWRPYLERAPGVHYGVVAQEVEAVLPELVSPGEDDMKSVSYQALVPLLLGAIQDLEASNLAQRDLIAQLEEERAQQEDFDAMLLYLEKQTAATQELLQGRDHEN